ncbi:hypothetical protein CHS0354_007125 [Potamilus streckersoni]|uniref:Uncharacterized protein n=1 Tax=Potamilus streckersoni TaxID=2493646 RepID=A0AAE0T341_9BIVA|nr:hypothetical protein CHS0354_007125 [Potamilus streckersoni]
MRFIYITGGSRFENQPHIDYAVVGETFIVRSWSLNDASLSITIKEGDMVRLSASFKAGTYAIAEDKKNRLVLKHNIADKEVSLIFDKVGNEDEGQYEMKENYNKSNGETHANKDDTWIFRLKVLKPDEIKRVNVGENVSIMRLNKSNTTFLRLYHNDQFVAVLKDTDCDLNYTSPLYGRLRCERDKAENRYMIELQNVKQNDAGLYRVNVDGYDTGRCFLNITDLTATSKSSSVTSNTVEELFPHAISSVIGTSVVSRLSTITIQDSTEAFYYSQLSTESLSATAKSSSPQNISNPGEYRYNNG